MAQLNSSGKYNEVSIIRKDLRLRLKLGAWEGAVAAVVVWAATLLPRRAKLNSKIQCGPLIAALALDGYAILLQGATISDKSAFREAE